MDLNIEMSKILIEEIVRELLKEIKPELTEKEFDDFKPVWQKTGNPFDAPLLWKMTHQ